MTTQMYLASMEHEERRADLSQWFTPPETAARIARFALEVVTQYGKPLRVLEPSCGHGALVKALLARRCRGYDVHVVGVDIDLRNVAVCESAFPDEVFVHRDFLTVDPKELGPFDIAVMNSPFEDGQAASHAAHALLFAPIVIAHMPLSTLEGQERAERFWPNAELHRMAICASRPKYEGEGGKTAMMTVELRRRSSRGVRGSTQVEWW